MTKLKLAMEICCGSISISRTCDSTSKKFMKRTSKLATVQECQLNRTKPREIKDGSCKPPEKNNVKKA